MGQLLFDGQEHFSEFFRVRFVQVLNNAIRVIRGFDYFFERLVAGQFRNDRLKRDIEDHPEQLVFPHAGHQERIAYRFFVDGTKALQLPPIQVDFAARVDRDVHSVFLLAEEGSFPFATLASLASLRHSQLNHFAVEFFQYVHVLVNRVFFLDSDFAGIDNRSENDPERLTVHFDSLGKSFALIPLEFPAVFFADSLEFFPGEIFI